MPCFSSKEENSNVKLCSSSVEYQEVKITQLWKHQPLLKVTEILLESFMYSYSPHSNLSVKGYILLKVYKFIVRN